jgi:probable HAF family extracellular repeat protein
MTFYFMSPFSMAQSYQVTDGTYGYGINNGGEVVGTSGFSAITETSHPFIWSRSHGMRDLVPPEDSNKFGTAFDINNQGQVVGDIDVVNKEAFLWTPDQGIQSLGVLPEIGFYSRANGVNELGQVVGEADLGLYAHAVLWENESGP